MLKQGRGLWQSARVHEEADASFARDGFSPPPSSIRTPDRASNERLRRRKGGMYAVVG